MEVFFFIHGQIRARRPVISASHFATRGQLIDGRFQPHRHSTPSSPAPFPRGKKRPRRALSLFPRLSSASGGCCTVTVDVQAGATSCLRVWRQGVAQARIETHSLPAVATSPYCHESLCSPVAIVNGLQKGISIVSNCPMPGLAITLLMMSKGQGARLAPRVLNQTIRNFPRPRKSTCPFLEEAVQKVHCAPRTFEASPFGADFFLVTSPRQPLWPEVAAPLIGVRTSRCQGETVVGHRADHRTARRLLGVATRSPVPRLISGRAARPQTGERHTYTVWWPVAKASLRIRHGPLAPQPAVGRCRPAARQDRACRSGARLARGLPPSITFRSCPVEVRALDVVEASHASPAPALRPRRS